MSHSNNIPALLTFACAFIVSYVLVGTDCVPCDKFIAFEFLFTFIGVLIGFALSLFTHVVGLIDKLKTKYNAIQDIAERDNKINNVNAIYREMKDDINFMFASLVIIVVVYIVSGILKQAVLMAVFYDYVSLSCYEILAQIKNAIILSIFFLCIFSIKDLIGISFKLSKYTVLDE